MDKHWFKNRKYGIGWRPATWEGWLVIAVYVATGIAIAVQSEKYSYTPEGTLYKFVVPLLAVTFLLLMIVWRTGEPLEWRWGDKSERDEER